MSSLDRPLRDRRLRRLRAWLPDVAVGLLVLLVGWWELQDNPLVVEVSLGDAYYVIIGLAVAAALSRRAPAVGLVLVWLASIVQVVSNVPLLFVQLSVALVAFGCARWGHGATVVVSGLSIPIGMAIAVVTIRSDFYQPFSVRSSQPFYDLFEVVPDVGVVGVLAAATLLPLGAPWLAGLALRFLARARRSQASQEIAEADAAQADAAREQAQELAALRESQARMASDVHDVVGHSLATILVQAESAQYLPDDPATLKATLATIAVSARDSLRDVRGVLSATQQTGATSLHRPGALDELIDGVRRSGYAVEATEVGRPQPLPPELAEVAYRVLQEMLTNAMRHGRRNASLHVERHWGGELRIEVVNAVDVEGDGWDDAMDRTRPETPTDGEASERRGLPGMQRRLESVGGRLDTRRRAETFTATAWVPVRG